MNRHHLTLLGSVTLLLSVLPQAVAAQVGQQAMTSADSLFLAKLASFKVSADTTVDLTALRREYAATSLYSPYDSDRPDQRRRMWERVNAGDAAAAGQIADTLLATNYFDIDAQVGAAVAARARGDSATAARHAATARAIVRSIESTGDGRTREHPLFVLAVDEEYSYLSTRGLRRVGMQSLADCGGRECDRLEVAGSDGKRIDLYFDVSLATEWMTNQFREGEKKDKPKG